MRESKLAKTISIINVFILGVGAFMCFYPFYFTIINSISGQAHIGEGIYLLPRGFTLSNYVKIFSQNDIGHAFFISVSRTIIGCIATICFSSMFAYAVSKKSMPVRKVIYFLSVIVMYFNSGIIPWYVTLKAYGLKNNFLLYILPAAFIPFYMILLKTFFEQLPQSIEESAFVEGAGHFTIFSIIVMPVSLPIIATIAIFTAVGQWNSWTDNLFLAQDKKLETLQYLLYQILRESSSFDIRNTKEMEQLSKRLSPTSVRLAITVIVTFPIMIVYPILQKYFMSGILIGSVKG